VHLAEAEPSEGPWMRYRQRKFFPDGDFRRFVDHVLSTTPKGDEIDLVFGGDFIEFEGPRVVDGETRFVDTPRTEAESVETLDRVVRDHPEFFRAIADVVRAGHRVVFVPGNHDVQLTFPGVQQRLRQHLGLHVPEIPQDRLNDRVRVRTWFFQTHDGVHVEHGNQYDAYCAFRDPLQPLTDTCTGDTGAQRSEIQPTVGSVAFRHLISRMGYFNAYDERSYMLSVPKYFAHWAKHYLFSRRSLGATWFIGALRVVGTILAARPAKKVAEILRREAEATRTAFAEAHRLDRDWLDNHAALFAEPADGDPHRLVRELRLDYMLLATIGVTGMLVSAFKPRLGLWMAASAVVAGVAHELIRPHRGVEAEYANIEQVARRIAKIYRARAVVFGHTHIPRCEAEDGVVFCNTGAWTPDAPGPDELDEERKPRARPIVWLHRPADDHGAPIEGGLYRFGEHGLLPQIVVSSRRRERASMVQDLEQLRPTVV